MLSSQGLILGKVGNSSAPSLLQATGMLFNPGIASEVACQAFLGTHYARWAKDRIIRVTNYVHLLTCAPAGAGKSVSVLVPNLLSYLGSCVVTDPKGELFTLTAEHRQTKLGQKVFLCDPFRICNARSSGFNPLDAIDASKPDFLSRCKDLANMLVVRTGEERDPHWNDAAELILTSIIAFICACESNKQLRTLRTVRRIISSPGKFGGAIKTMQEVKGFWNIIADHGRLCQWFVDRELGSVMTTVQRHTEWMDDPHVSECLLHTTFDPSLLRTGRVTVYFVLPQDRFATFAALMRVWIGSTLRITTRGAPSEKNPILFLLDEAGHLGHMQVLQDAVTVMRGAGIRLWFFFQSLSQVHETYGKHAPVILDNLGTQQFFGITGFETAEAISKKIGDQTIALRTESGGTSDSRPLGFSLNGEERGSSSVSRNWSVSELGRRLLKPEEILVLPDNIALIFHRNLPVIVARRLFYYTAREFRNGGDGRQAGMGGAAFLTLTCAAMLAMFVICVADEIKPRKPEPGWESWQFRITPPGKQPMIPTIPGRYPPDFSRTGPFTTPPASTPYRPYLREGR